MPTALWNARQGFVLGIVGIWLLAVIIAYTALLHYKQSSGEVQTASAFDPVVSAGGQPTLRVFLHPHCPCSRATLTELAAILEKAGSRLVVEIHFVRPSGVVANWDNSTIRAIAESMDGVHVATDGDGDLARRYGARTSGHAVLYDANGVLRYSGGITRSRGHDGESPGRRAILAALQGEAHASEFPVFGCPLFAPLTP